MDGLFAERPAQIPETLISQYLGRLYPEAGVGHVAPNARDLCLAAIDAAFAAYHIATARR